MACPDEPAARLEGLPIGRRDARLLTTIEYPDLFFTSALTGANVAVLASLPENLPEARAAELIALGLAPMHGFDEDDRGEARRILYALDAILRLHFAQEEELLISMTSPTGAVP